MAEENDYWLDMEIQPMVIASLLRQYRRYREVDMHQIEHEIMSFKDFVNQIIVRGMTVYEPMLADLETQLKVILDG